ncbi:glucokinase [Agrobacterium sp. MOPV5]|uniref:glucokinase n=1 Tax=Agrobacterium leguminum TaxID=2792015 RepID=UPI0018C1E12B|nr:glucokinase [Agrobacterium leguminum]MBG0511607.1 glucokinase [Agrobacterium leguminum]
MRILAGDIGGTKALLGLYEFDGAAARLVRTDRYAVRDFGSLNDVAQRFLGVDRADIACFGAPGPSNPDRMTMANLDWVLDRRDLSKSLGIETVLLTNDIEATGHGLSALSSAQLSTLNAGEPAEVGTTCVIAVGTGLGTGFLTLQCDQYAPQPSEGGHVDFTPRDDDEEDLTRYLRRRHGGRVSVETVVSGQGLTLIFRFLRDVRGMGEPVWLADEIMRADDPNPVISRVAMEGQSALCERALDMFVAALGAAAGNLALTTCATGGVYLAGGIAPAILKKLNDGTLMRTFTEKGRLSKYVKSMPVHVVLDQSTALQGAAKYARTHQREPRVIWVEPHPTAQVQTIPRLTNPVRGGAHGASGK